MNEIQVIARTPLRRSARRQFLFFSTVLALTGFAAWVMADILWRGGLTGVEMALLILFVPMFGMVAVGFVQAVFGFIILLRHRDPYSISRTLPAHALKLDELPATAIVLPIYNENVGRVYEGLRTMYLDLARAGCADRFDFFILSDSTDPNKWIEEEVAWLDLCKQLKGFGRIFYRKRAAPLNRKSGNISDFLRRWGRKYRYMVVLDADSLMDGETLVRFVRIGEAHPRIGILQSLVVGAPSRSAFARVFQFGMRAGMRTYTMGAAWWSADCGPFWGHNALVRVDAFTRHCELPQLAGDRHILSHDQIEAVLMRRAGYEVRVLPIECGSYEENPPTILEFMRRDERWCQGNMQYFRLVGLPGLLPMSRFQLVWAISMFIGVPAWTAIIALSGLIAATGGPGPGFPAASAAGLYLLFLAFYLAPKLAGFVDVVLTPGGVARYGGAGRFVAGSLLEIAASFFIGAAVTLRTSLFLAGLALGRTIGWGGQSRDAHGLPWRTALGVLWPQTLFGLLLYGVGLALAPGLLLWSLPLTLGYLLAAPFAWASALPTLGELFAASGLCALPEEFAEPALLVDVRRAGQTIVAPVGVPPARELEPVLD